ncbi:hypothetical protein GCM10007415_02770 [Parapedobacter pyrenivorans]|uniref:DUF5777 domain-containing protein n=1 Tax=Parapedobacter pyrenivorans TaxID=1305674 RepID=A0A917HD25_9SPHI|nr:DUF5777 family beta-barrel protein [Parapedobacter pyrenivorans]GGG74671.1 hypothetical protein GCM10007415_02770 [Parapedobacter pyrenivorans]
MKILVIAKRHLLIALILLIACASLSAQTDLEKALASDSTRDAREAVEATFKTTRIINSQSIETIHKHELDFKVDHRFGDIAGSNGGAKNFFGLDNSTDIKIGFEYGISDDLNVGIARAKGATRVSQLYEANLKYRLLRQTVDDKMPLSVTGYLSLTIPGVQADQESDDEATSYRQFSDRLNLVGQLIIARKFGSNFSLALHPTYIRRNTTASYDGEDNLFALGIGGRLKVSRRMALVMDYFLPFRSTASKERYANAITALYNPLGVGLEIETGGHVFNLNFTNATAIQEMQYIPETTSSWTKGQFRWGFTISRRFSLGGKAKD